MDFWQANVKVLLDYVTTVTGALTIFLLIAVGLSAFFSKTLRFWALVIYFLILFVGPVPEVANDSTSTFKPLVQPFAYFRQNSRALMSLMFIVVVPIALLWGRSLAERSFASYLYLIFQIAWSFLQIVFGGNSIKIVLGLLCFFCVWFVITARPLKTLEDWYAGWRPVIWSMIAFLACHVLLFALHSPGMLAGNRLQGMTSNPQFTAQDLALSCIVLAALGADTEFRRYVRMPLWLIWTCAGVAGAMLGMTGSRGGALFLVVGVLVLFGKRVVRAALIILPAAVIIYFVGNYFFFTEQSSSDALQRIFSGQDTRSAIISNLFNQWMRSPILGDGGDISSGYTECLYLLVAVRTGILGLLAICLVVGSAIYVTYRGSALNKDRLGVVQRLPLAIVFAMAVQNITEAGLLSQFTISTTVFLMACELGSKAYLLREAEPVSAYESTDVFAHQSVAVV